MADTSTKPRSHRGKLWGWSILLLVFFAYTWSGPFAPAAVKVTRQYNGLYKRDNPSTGNSTLVHRNDYSCSEKNPCSNGACCGPSGYCGYGPTYCGTGCVSNCDATAECGEFAETPGQACPLNVCCSQYGFVSSLPGRMFDHNRRRGSWAFHGHGADGTIAVRYN